MVSLLLLLSDVARQPFALSRRSLLSSSCDWCLISVANFSSKKLNFWKKKKKTNHHHHHRENVSDPTFPSEEKRREEKRRERLAPRSRSRKKVSTTTTTTRPTRPLALARKREKIFEFVAHTKKKVSAQSEIGERRAPCCSRRHLRVSSIFARVFSRRLRPRTVSGSARVARSSFRSLFLPRH